MCGIFGIISTGKLRCTSSQARGLIESFYVLSESRGKEAAGGALMLDDRIEIVKAPVRGRDFLALRESKPIQEGLVRALGAGNPIVLIGHTRMVTNGGDHIHGNNQPVIKSGLVAIHNGIIVNDQELWSRLSDEKREFEVDTEVLLALVARQIRHGCALADAVSVGMRELKGANSIALMSSGHDGVILATANGSMFLAHEASAGLTVFASERSILERIIEKRLHPVASMTSKSVSQVLPGQLVSIPLASATPAVECWTDELPKSQIASTTPRSIVDHVVARLESKTGMLSTNRSRHAQIEAAARVDWPAIRRLRRCTRCVLPETFPFIEFDAAGVCSLCNAHKPLVLRGTEVLSKEFEAIKRSDGAPELLIPLSGGRDSCFGLHKIVREFGMKPVAYTYDWGMVTDLARRNISRMCGELGIEHVLISADIRRKREFIRKNVAAWLRTPHLGTVPLFMAGDKQFFYYANMLKNEMRLARTMLSVNPLERTDFKVGFCNINELYHKKHYYEPNFINKLRLIGFYAGQFLSNTAYVNASLFDSAFAYFSYYMIPKDFTSIFDYLPWHEHEVESILLGQYGWEISSDTKSTWRIGDGTAAFYNYIYVRVAGLSENDTFRSNQIREGLISRDEALARTYEDNQPRIESIAWYFDTIGLDAVEAIKTINKMPKRY